MIKVAVIFAFLAASAIATPVNKCKSGLPQPVQVNIQNCDKQPCTFVKGKDVVLELTFKAPERLPVIRTQVKATAKGITTEFPLPEPDACKGLVNAKCPVEAGQTVTYKLVTPVNKKIPNISLGLEFTLQNANKKGFTCFQVNGRVVNA